MITKDSVEAFLASATQPRFGFISADSVAPGNQVFIQLMATRIGKKFEIEPDATELLLKALTLDPSSPRRAMRAAYLVGELGWPDSRICEKLRQLVAAAPGSEFHYQRIAAVSLLQLGQQTSKEAMAIVVDEAKKQVAGYL